MSIMNSAEAARLALDEAAQHLDNVIVIYVEPDKTAKPLSFTKRLSLPEADDMQLPFAVGCAQAGALPVLDLHALENAEERFAAMLRAIGADRLPPMVVRVSLRHPFPIAGARVIAPKNPRELAGALRYALRSGEICVVAENPLDAYEACEVPDDWEELFGEALEMPHEETESVNTVTTEAPEECCDDDTADESPVPVDEAAADDAAESVTGEQAAECAAPVCEESTDTAQHDTVGTDIESATPAAQTAEVAESEPECEENDPGDAPAEDCQDEVEAEADEAPVTETVEPSAQIGMPAFRSRRYDPAELQRTAQLLNITRETLMRLCCRCAEDMAEIVIEADAEPGEIACLPPHEKVACLWVGADRLAICWKTAQMDADAARNLLNDVASYIALPARLILDKEN